MLRAGAAVLEYSYLVEDWRADAKNLQTSCSFVEVSCRVVATRNQSPPQPCSVVMRTGTRLTVAGALKTGAATSVALYPQLSTLLSGLYPVFTYTPNSPHFGQCTTLSKTSPENNIWARIGDGCHALNRSPFILCPRSFGWYAQCNYYCRMGFRSRWTRHAVFGPILSTYSGAMCLVSDASQHPTTK